ncbi:MAG TPA: hypothetical protein VEZ88_11500 [Steroidobacteraceae bacterium]|nr:hypothetical protein [Steroidobacteraceae bacterium]
MLRVSDLVEVRSAEEILATLDAAGALEQLPFMPEMLSFCGRRYRVSAIAHKTCDTVSNSGGRKLQGTVHLSGLRCDGSAHGGCQAACSIFWKEAWLRRVVPQEAAAALPALRSVGDLTESQLRAGVSHRAPGGEEVFQCQATQLVVFTQPLNWWDFSQYVRDVSSGNHGLLHVVRVLLLAGIKCLQRLPFGYKVSQALYNTVHRLMTGGRSPYVDGAVAHGVLTPQGTLDLQPGELVRVKPLDEIALTLNSENKNRGLSFDPEMARFCGHEYRVRGRITRIVDERTGQMLQMKNPCITLEGVACLGEYSRCRLLCPRAITPYWREIWLQRESPDKVASVGRDR